MALKQIADVLFGKWKSKTPKPKQSSQIFMILEHVIFECPVLAVL